MAVAFARIYGSECISDSGPRASARR